MAVLERSCDSRVIFPEQLLQQEARAADLGHVVSEEPVHGNAISTSRSSFMFHLFTCDSTNMYIMLTEQLATITDLTQPSSKL